VSEPFHRRFREPACRLIDWRRTPGLRRWVSTIAPIMATKSTRPAIWK